MFTTYNHQNVAYHHIWSQNVTLKRWLSTPYYAQNVFVHHIWPSQSGCSLQNWPKKWLIITCNPQKFTDSPVVDPGLRWGPRCKIFSHDPMCGAREGPKALFWYIFSYAKGEKLGPGGPWPPRTPGSATVAKHNLKKGWLQHIMFKDFWSWHITLQNWLINTNPPSKISRSLYKTFKMWLIIR